VSIGTGGGAQGLAPIVQGDAGQEAVDLGQFIENNLAIIMSSPLTSSNPQDYIDAHRNEYETMLKHGTDKALAYLLAQFETGNNTDLRGQIMMRLCKEMLGARNNVTDASLNPEEWYNALVIREEVVLPDFVYSGDDAIEKLVYTTEIAQYATQRGFTVVTPRIHGSYEEGDRLKVFVTTHSPTYRLYDNVLDDVGGSSVPAAITYKKNPQGDYELVDYEQARDGSEFAPSIRKFCTMPLSGNDIAGLADKMLGVSGHFEGVRILQRENLRKHLEANGITDAILYSYSGEIEFSIGNP